MSPDSLPTLDPILNVPCNEGASLAIAGKSVTALPQVIHVDREKCVNCHACIAVCPVKTCNDGSGAYVNLNPDTCIACGRCLTACTHHARYVSDDLGNWMHDKGCEKMVAVVAPSVAANFPDQYLRLNGWLKSIGVSAVFDVSFGAELCAKSYADYIQRHPSKTIIAQPCAAIVSFIQIHRPELQEYLAPIDSPMVHTMKMVRQHFPQYSGYKILVISPCPAKKREFVETGYGDYNVTFASLRSYFERNAIRLDDFAEELYETPTPEIAVKFPEPGGFGQTLERHLPGVGEKTRLIQGQEVIYPYLAGLAEAVASHPQGMPLLVDCLSCPHGCNCGPASIASERKIDEVEYHTRKRSHDLQKNNRDNGEVERLLDQSWDATTYVRQYADLSCNNQIRRPTQQEEKSILASMHKYTEKDQYNCCSCGYGSCRDMTVAIFNGLNKPQNCHHFLAQEREIAQTQLAEYRDDLEKLVERRTAELKAANQQLHQENFERLKAEIALKSNKVLLREVLHGSPIPQFVIGKDHRIIYWNKALEQLTGISSGEIVGTRDQWRVFYEAARPCLADLLMEDDFEGIRRYYSDHCKRSDLLEDAYVGTYYFAHFGEYGKWLYCTAAVLRDVDGNMIGAVETMEDVTQQHLAEAKLAASQRAAEAANRAKSAFLANMSHEIRTPMTAIMGYLDLLSEGCARRCEFLKSDVGNPLDVISHNAKHLLELIDDILDLSKIEAGRFEIERRTCSVSELLNEVVALMNVRAAAKGLTLNVECKTPIPATIETDRMRLKQILLNILGNAVKFTECGSIRITLELAPQAYAPILRIRIEDTGIGMTPEVLYAIFRPFTQADVSTSRKYGGTGLGLTICKRLAELLGGDICVESEPGCGSVFAITVPTGSLNGIAMIDRIIVLPSSGQGGSATAEPVVVKLQSLQGRRVLLAEDGTDNQRFISFLLKRLHAEVVVAENGQAALDRVEQATAEGTPFDLILMDMQMPVMDGYQTTQELRRKLWSGPIIALTAHAMSDDRQRCLDAGCTDYLSKPIDRDRFVELLLRYAKPAASAQAIS